MKIFPSTCTESGRTAGKSPDDVLPVAFFLVEDTKSLSEENMDSARGRRVPCFAPTAGLRRHPAVRAGIDTALPQGRPRLLAALAQERPSVTGAVRQLLCLRKKKSRSAK